MSAFTLNLPPMTGVRWVNVLTLTITPTIAAWGLFFAPLVFKTVVFAVVYYVFSMLGGYNLHTHSRMVY